ncbi:uncharacterized protein LOC127735086 [Mytilus californianus]|uniref:uncharacterized protein LOC127735086 n=1 Tax=Mytilus californianus TaxID=6549 RepID=UPI002247C15F|nr:uncharacterized protein LOC127735086 [Mytilus californianus]
MEGIKLYVVIVCLLACDAYDKPAVYSSEEKYPDSDDKTVYPEGYKALEQYPDSSAKKAYSPVYKSATKYATSKGCGPFNCYYAFDCGFAPQLCTSNCLKHKGCNLGNCIDNSWCCCDDCPKI